VIRLPEHAVLPTGELDCNGDCRLSGLPPAYCGLKCHRNSPDVGVVDEIRDAA
jgi:hypothetical protein